jgi:VWFA-related protein
MPPPTRAPHGRRAFVAASLIAIGAGLLAAAAAQAPRQPTFRSGVELVEIDAVVTDPQGNPVTTLTADDFEILENGRPQAIALFTLVNIPIEKLDRPLYRPGPVEPDVATNQRPEGRLYLIALDEVPGDQALRTRRFLRRFVERYFAANDVGAVVYIGRGRSRDSQDFTSNPRLLLAAIDRFSGGFASEAPPPPDPASLSPLAGIGGPGGVGDADYLLRSRMRALRDLAEYMSGLRGRRKAMLLVSTGLGFDMFNVIDYQGGVMSLATEDAHAAMTAATRGNLTIYAIDPRGLSPDGALGDSDTAFSAEQRGAARDSRRELRTMAELTGGFAFTDQNDFDLAFTRIVRENSAYYVLGYYPADERRDGRYRRLRVRVRRPGLQVRSRGGYVAPTSRSAARTEPAAAAPGALAPAVAEAIRSPLSHPGVPMTIVAAAHRGTPGETSVQIVAELDASTFALVEKDGLMTGQIELAWTAANEAGRAFPGQRFTIDLRLRPETHERLGQARLRMPFGIRLPPGRYQLRVAAGDRGGRAGSVVADLDVPDFSQPPLAMSAVSLIVPATDAALNPRHLDPMRDILPGPVTAQRDFRAGDTLTVFAEIYENLRRPATHSVEVRTELRADDGRVLQTITEQRSSSELEGRSGGYGVASPLDLDGVEPGIYVIHVEATANIGDRPTVSRDVLIRVR